MKFASRDGQFLELRILGYEFPHIETAEYDSNWLVVAGNVTHSRGSWQFTHPCLLTYEAEQLASWMDALVETDRFPTTCGFIEPNLEFRALLNMNRPMHLGGLDVDHQLELFRRLDRQFAHLRALKYAIGIDCPSPAGTCRCGASNEEPPPLTPSHPPSRVSCARLL